MNAGGGAQYRKRRLFLNQPQRLPKPKHKLSASKKDAVSAGKHFLSESYLQKEGQNGAGPNLQYTKDLMAIATTKPLAATGSKEDPRGGTSATNNSAYAASMADPRGQFNDSGPTKSAEAPDNDYQAAADGPLSANTQATTK